VARNLKRAVSKGFNDCRVIPLQNDKLLVGWQQYEDDGTPCMAESSQVAVKFDTSLLNRIRDEIITRGHPSLTTSSKPPDATKGCLAVDPAGRLAGASPNPSRTAASSGFRRQTGPLPRRAANSPTSRIRVDALP
jgi:hypothetical protein